MRMRRRKHTDPVAEARMARRAALRVERERDRLDLACRLRDFGNATGDPYPSLAALRIYESARDARRAELVGPPTPEEIAAAAERDERQRRSREWWFGCPRCSRTIAIEMPAPRCKHCGINMVQVRRVVAS